MVEYQYNRDKERHFSENYSPGCGQCCVKINMADQSEQEKQLEKEIDKEVEKLKYYLEQANDLIAEGDYKEIEVVNKRTSNILDKIHNLTSDMQELKIENGAHTQRAIRQWKKEVKDKFSYLLVEMDKLIEFLGSRQKKINDEAEQNQLKSKYEKEELYREELRNQERQLWEEKCMAELKMTEKKLEVQKAAKATMAKLPELKITPFNGSAVDLIRFENMFTTQVHCRQISDEEKFGYLLEMVSPKVRSRISNLKPSSLGYKTAWERLKKDYGHPKLVINAHMDEIINLTPVKGMNYEKVMEFYEALSKNYDALEALGEGDKLQGFVMTTLNKLPNVKPDLVRSDDEWEDWSMENLISGLQKWLRRNKVEDNTNQNKKPEKNWFTGKGSGTQKPHCIFCENHEHWSDKCIKWKKLDQRKKFFVEKNLCFNCGRAGHRGNQCRSRGCFKCKAKHHTSLCDKEDADGSVFTGYTPPVEGQTLPPMLPVKIKETTLWAYLDTGSNRNFISSDAVKRLKLTPVRHETRQIITLSGTSKQSMPIYETTMHSLDGKSSEKIELTGSKMGDFTTVRRPDLNDLKWKYEHTRNKRFYVKPGDEYTMHIILGDSTYCRIKTEEVHKGKPGKPIVEGTSFGWTIHGGEFSSDGCYYTREINDYQRLYSLDVLGVEDRGENDQLDVCQEFKENITINQDNRYEVKVPWIPGASYVKPMKYRADSGYNELRRRSNTMKVCTESTRRSF